MNNWNIYIAGVGGQGLVLTTRILADTAFREGYDVRTNDVIGLSQRGGKVYGSVRFGERIYSSQIKKGTGDILLGLEQLEALRWAPELKPSADILISTEIIFPNRVLFEKDEYPTGIPESLATLGFKVKQIDAKAAALTTGNQKTSNLVLLGALSRLLPLSLDAWKASISANVPEKTIEENLKAFSLGMNL